MVAYKKFTNIERDRVVNKMTNKVLEKEFKPIILEIEKEISELFMKNIPTEVFEFEKKYPYLLDKDDLTLYGYDFLTSEEHKKYDLYSRWGNNCPNFHIENVYNRMVADTDIHGYQLDNKLVIYIQENAPEIAEKIKNITIKILGMKDWTDKLSCTLSNIRTINKLKEEFPEAYSIYKNLYREPENCKKIKDKNGQTTSFCDNIEKLRAEYNKIVK